MESFVFHNPTKIVFGKGSISKMSDLVQKKKVLMLYGGGSIKKNGVYEQVIKGLSNCEVVELGGVQPNPTYEKCMEAVELIKKENIDFILAVGGGSVIDSAKFISAAVHYTHKDPWHICLGEVRSITNVIPFGAVLTLPATGSEMNMFSVISRGDEKMGFGHPKLYPQFSILDPEATFSLDKRQVGNGIVDAYVHTLEQYLTFPAGAPLQDRFAESVLQTLIEEGPKSFANPTDYNARANHVWCATMALSSVFGAGVPQDWTTHTIGHELTALYGIDHARTLALVWASNMRMRKANKMDKMVQYGKRVFGLQGTNEEIFEAAITKTNAFFESVGVPTSFKSYPEVKTDVGEVVAMRFKGRNMLEMGEKADLDLEKVTKVLGMAF